METNLKQKKTFQWRSEGDEVSLWMLIPSISKAKRNYFGVSSAGTADYRHGADIRPKFKLVLKGNGNEVLKKKEHLCSEAERTLVVR